jgi:hypothetical protein
MEFFFFLSGRGLGLFESNIQRFSWTMSSEEFNRFYSLHIFIRVIFSKRFKYTLYVASKRIVKRVQNFGCKT